MSQPEQSETTSVEEARAAMFGEHAKVEPTDYFDIVFDWPPSHESGRFVEVEDSGGHSIVGGKWIETPPYLVLRIPRAAHPEPTEDTIERMAEALTAYLWGKPVTNLTRELMAGAARAAYAAEHGGQ